LPSRRRRRRPGGREGGEVTHPGQDGLGKGRALSTAARGAARHFQRPRARATSSESKDLGGTAVAIRLDP